MGKREGNGKLMGKLDGQNGGLMGVKNRMEREKTGIQKKKRVKF